MRAGAWAAGMPRAAGRGLAGDPAGRSARDVARLGVFLALGVALHVLEAQLPALPLPGARLGLANVVSLVALYLWGVREALLLVVLRQVLGTLVMGTFLTAPFWFGLAGGMVSVAAMALLDHLARPLVSPVGVSLAGAAAHNLAQLAVARWVTAQGAVMAYLPLLLAFSLPAGALVGLAGARILEALAASILPGTHPPAPAAQPGRRPGLRPGDWGVGFGIALAAGILVWNIFVPPGAAGAEPAVAVVTVGDRIVAELPLDQEALLPVEAGSVHMVVEVAPGRVRVRTSDCPDRICLLTGWISRTGQSIVCLPGRAVVQVRGGGPAEYDALTR